jgi:hypothetical protein
MVVTPQMPSAITTMASAQKDRSLTSTRSPTRRSRTKVSGAMAGNLETAWTDRGVRGSQDHAIQHLIPLGGLA